MSQKVHHFYYTVHRGDDPEADPKQPPSREHQSQGAHTQYFLENSMKLKKKLVRWRGRERTGGTPKSATGIYYLANVFLETEPRVVMYTYLLRSFLKQKISIWGWPQSGINLRHPPPPAWLEIILKGGFAEIGIFQTFDPKFCSLEWVRDCFKAFFLETGIFQSYISSELFVQWNRSSPCRHCTMFTNITMNSHPTQSRIIYWLVQLILIKKGIQYNGRRVSTRIRCR